MQISSLINSTNEDPLDEPKILIRFAPYINTDACPTADEITNYLNRTDKHIFLMLGQRHFSISSKAYELSLREFAVILWKVSLLRRITNKGRKLEKSNKSFFEFKPELDLIKRNIGHVPVDQFLGLGQEAKEMRCLRIWKNLRKYFSFQETEHGWSVHHSAFQQIDTPERIGSVINTILPIRKKAQKRRQKGLLSNSEEDQDVVENLPNRNVSPIHPALVNIVQEERKHLGF
jgi:hypothetical protein